jgi:hypothetical protein
VNRKKTPKKLSPFNEQENPKAKKFNNTSSVPE